MLVDLNFRNAFSEVYEILSYLDEEDYNKIPNEVICAIEENRNLDYVYYIDESIDFVEQEMMEETRAILFNLFRDYFATDSQRVKIFKIQELERLKLEDEKRLKYSVNVFENTKNEEIVENTKMSKEKIDSVNSLVKKEKWYIKIFRKIKNSFK